MKRTNEMIFADIKANGFMTERDMKLLKNRSNDEQKDCFDYDLLNSINEGCGIPIDEEWANKGIKWLKSLLKKNGEPKAGQPLDTVKLILSRTQNQMILHSEDFMMQGGMDLEIISLCMVSVEWNTM